MPQNIAHARHAVTAVLVTHDGARWLPDTLQALVQQQRPLQRIIAVDNGSRDRSEALLVDALGTAHVRSLSRDAGYGAAIAEALAENPAGSGRDDATHWIWLIHDDSAPAPDALARLLRCADEHPLAAVLGPKVRDWHDHRVLLEVGVTIDGAGRRETGLEPREFDQGQRDGDRAVLAVGSAGMLIRHDVWDALGGFDPELRLFRDDIDFCWRVNAAGHQVVVATEAVMFHAEASARRRRQLATRGKHPHRIDRRNALYVLFANLPAGALLVAQVRSVFGSLLRFWLFLLAKQPAVAFDEVAALVHVFCHPWRMLRARRARARGRRKTYGAIRPYMPRGQAISRLSAMINAFMSGAGPVDSAGRHHADGSLDTEDPDEMLLADHGLTQRLFGNPGFLLFLGLIGVTLVASRGLWGAGQLGGGALVPVRGGASDLWNAYLAGWHETGLGTASSMPPSTAVLALAATVAFGKPWLAVTVLLLGCVPLAGATAYFAARRVVTHRPSRVAVAASYGLLPVGTGAVAAGRLGSAVAFVLLPAIAALFVRMLNPPRRPARRAAWGCGLLLAVATAFVPLMWPLVIIGGGLVAVAHGVDRRGLAANLAIPVLAPPVLLLPWTLSLLRNPAMFLFEIGLNRPGLAAGKLPASHLLLLSPGGPGMPPIWVTAGVVLAGGAALCLHTRRLVIAGAWGLGLFGLLATILVSKLRLIPVTGEAEVNPWPGIALAFAALGILVAAALAAQILNQPTQTDRRIRLAGRAVTVLACVTPTLAALAWVVSGMSGPLTRDQSVTVPPYVAALSGGGSQARTLVIRPGKPSGAVSYAVTGREPPVPGQAAMPGSGTAVARLGSVVSGLTSGRGGDDGRALRGFGIRFVLLPKPIDHRLVRVLDGVPGISRVSVTPDYGLWRLNGPTGRVRIVGHDGSILPVRSSPVDVDGTKVPAGSTRRVLELAEPADGGWHARLNGKDLTPTTVDGWAQGFELPASGGELTVTRGMFWHRVGLTVQGVAALIVLVLALPGGKIDEEEAAQEARRDGRRHEPRRARGHRARRGAGGVPAQHTAASTRTSGDTEADEGAQQPSDDRLPAPRRAKSIR